MKPLFAGMLEDTFQYLLQFSIAHEGDTPFMYNNWPAKNPNRDVTIGVGHALTTEDDAASQCAKFWVIKTGKHPTPDEMKEEFRRVYNTRRIDGNPGNLYSAFRDPSPLKMDRDAMLGDLREKMLGFWDSRGAKLPDFSSIPAQAQVALMSYNYGARLSTAGDMCTAVRAGDYLTAAKETFVSGWDPQKNAAHKQLMLNAATIVATGMDLNTLPPVTGKNPFKPPPPVAGAANTLDPAQLAGKWRVAIGTWNGFFFFKAKGDISWADSDDSMKHEGTWSEYNGRLVWWFFDKGDFRIFTLPLPLSTGNADGTILPAGQGRFTMSNVMNKNPATGTSGPLGSRSNDRPSDAGTLAVVATPMPGPLGKKLVR
jgi:hypothetical protein